jgi:hypothetical protein
MLCDIEVKDKKIQSHYVINFHNWYINIFDEVYYWIVCDYHQSFISKSKWSSNYLGCRWSL